MMYLTFYDPLAFLNDIKNNAIPTPHQKIIWVVEGYVK